MCSCKKKGPVHMIAWVLVFIGALNWGLVGLGGFIGTNLNVVDLVFSWAPAVGWIIYLLVGISALVLMFGKKSDDSDEEQAETSQPDMKTQERQQNFQTAGNQPPASGGTDNEGQA